ncbi:MAG TPA: alpha/beta hydrolase-fold protein [Puia sp.]|nr:alpha/beta hydrolase-fold protein [Puia sp.]
MKRLIPLLLLFPFFSCRHGEQTQDELYSRHLQRKVALTILHTPVPKDRSRLNLLILNGQDLEKLRVRETMDSLYKKGEIQPLVIIGVGAGDTAKEYGVADKPDYLGRGNRASYYDAFINDELYPFAKKQSGVRKFNTVAIAGCSLGGLSAFDIAWNHPDKISRVGVFSGAFWWRNKALEDSSYSDEANRIMYVKLKASRKKPGLQYWFYAGGAEEKSDRDKDSIIDVIDDTKDIIALLQKKNVASASDIVYRENKDGKHDYASWSQVFLDFLVWAFGVNR